MPGCHEGFGHFEDTSFHAAAFKGREDLKDCESV
jgi:hypothetical protein